MTNRLTSEDLVRFRDAAQKAQETCDEVLSSTERWHNTAKRNLLPPQELASVQEAAFKTFSNLLDVKVDSERARFQLQQRLSKTHGQDDPQMIADLEHQKTILDNACESMMKDFEPAKKTLDSLLGGNQDDPLTSTWNSFLGKTPHFNSFAARQRTRSVSAGTESEMHTTRSPINRRKNSLDESILKKDSDDAKQSGISKEEMFKYETLFSQ